MIKLSFAALVVSLVVFGVSIRMKDRLPPQRDILPQTYSAPVQTPTSTAKFNITKKGINYTIEPLFDYELSGLVVAYHISNHYTDSSHQQWKDFINVSDICVIWGANIKEDIYTKFKYSHSDWTCFFQTHDDAAWQAFDKYAVSNNHILVADTRLAKKILSTRVGDQIWLRGMLASYSNDRGFNRGTSTTRYDEGQGACEVIYVTDFKILKRSNPQWDAINFLSKIFAAASVILLILSIVLPGKDDDRQSSEPAQNVSGQ